MTAPRVSVILCGYNQAAYVRSAVESVLAQSYQDWELLAFDNGSSDGSAEILRAYADEPRVQLFLRPRNGPVSALTNEAIRAAHGDVIAFLYADDYYKPEKLERQLRVLDQLPSDYGVVYGPVDRLNVKSGVQWEEPCMAYSGAIFRPMCLRILEGAIQMGGVLVRREWLLRIPFLESVFIEGEGIFLRLAPHCKFQYVPGGTVVMRDHDANGGKAMRVNHEIIMATLQAISQDTALSLEDRRCLRKHIAITRRCAGWGNLRLGGDAAWSRQRFLDAVRERRAEVLHPYVWFGTALSWVPPALRGRINHLGHWLRRAPGNRALVEKYF